MTTHILAIDQGTSATKAVLVDNAGHIVAKASAPVSEQHPQPGWVEQDAEDIWASVRTAAQQCLVQAPAGEVMAVGLSTQRESALIWERSTGHAITPLLSWQDQRTVKLCERLAAGSGVEHMVRERSGLPLDPMFSAPKIAWLLDQIDPDRRQARSGKWCAGTVDAYLLARMGAEGVVEVGNASRTQLLDVRKAAWDPDLLALFDIPAQTLPQVQPSRRRHADAAALHPSLAGVPVHAVMADSHAALFAHGANRPGDVKATMGTGSSVMGLAAAGVLPHPGLCLTIAWDAGSGPLPALEGNIRAAGATLRWAADLFGLTSDAAAAIAAQHTSDGVCLVPGFNGLGAPWWDAHALGLVSGLTLATGRNQILAAALESIAHQVADMVDAMDSSVPGIQRLLVDGGPSRNPHLRQLLAEFIARPVVHGADAELSALGVAHLAGLGAGLWDEASLAALPRDQHQTPPASNDAETTALARSRWARAVAQSRCRGAA
jgi:glycerol kinase